MCYWRKHDVSEVLLWALRALDGITQAILCCTTSAPGVW